MLEVVASFYLYDLPRLHGQSGEVPPAVDGDALRQNRVQAPHLIPGQHAEPPALIRNSGHGDGNFFQESGGGKMKLLRKEKEKTVFCLSPQLWMSCF